MSTLAEQHAEHGERALSMIGQLSETRRLSNNTVVLFQGDYQALQAWAQLAQAHFTAANYYNNRETR